jgi:uncharacterized membrane protein required for colicin V production
MIAAVALKTTPWWQSLSFGWFDAAFVLILIFGYWRGRKRGMSREALPVSMWLVLVIAAGLGYQYLGQLLLQSGAIKYVFGSSFMPSTAAFVTSYLFIALVVFIIFSLIGKRFREKVSGSNAFGSGEYYLGMAAGLIRYFCITIFGLALLNAPFYSQAEVAASLAYKARWYGGGLNGYSGNYIPDLSDVQASVFRTSFVGPRIKDYMGYLLINSAPGGKHPAVAAPH